MPTAAKEKTVAVTRDKYQRAAGVFLTEYRGLSVADMQNLRANLREKGGELSVVKNTLFKLAIGDDANVIDEALLNGPTAIAFAYENESECAKVLIDFLKVNKNFVVKGGIVEGKTFDAKGVEDFSKLPSRDQLLAMLIGTIAAPLSNLIGTVEALYAQPIRTIGAVADKMAEGSPLPVTKQEDAPAQNEEPAAEAAASEEAPAETVVEAEVTEEAPTSDEASETTEE